LIYKVFVFHKEILSQNEALYPMLKTIL